MKSKILIGITLCFFGHLSYSQCFSPNSLDAIQMGPSGGSISRNISIACSGTFSASVASSHFSLSYTSNSITVTAPVTGDYHTAGIQLNINGQPRSFITVRQNEPPPPPCIVSGFNGGSYAGASQSIDFNLGFTNCSPHTFTFTKDNGQPLDSWITITQPSSSTLRVVLQANNGGSPRSVVVKGTSGQASFFGTISQACILRTWYPDSDNDGYRDPTGSSQQSCAEPSPGNWTTSTTIDNCPNYYSLSNVSFTWYPDADGDGFRDKEYQGEQDCSDRGSGWTQKTEIDLCPLIFSTTNVIPTWYYDFDDDNHASDQTTSCGSPGSGWKLGPLPIDDCDDGAFSLENQCSSDPDPSDQNYVYTRTYQVERETSTDFFNENDALIQQITYFDGLGRPMQQIGIDQSIDAEGEKKDIVTHIGYDDYGRQHRDWLPITDGSGTFGGYKPQDMEAATRAYYKNHENYGTDFSNMDEAYVNAYSEKYFEPSPLNRVLKQAAPGDAWALAKDANGNILPDADDHSIGFAYSANSHDPLDATNTAKDNVRLFKVITAFADNTYMPTLVYGDYGTGDPVGYYAQNELYKNITKDENHTGDAKNHTTEEFTDKQGRVVLKRTYGPFDVDKSGIIDTEESELPFDTYYVYDDYGNLTYVLPPKMEASTATLAAINTNMVELGYQYIYDHRNRLVEKRIPGKEWEYIIYNKLDQPIMTQDANQRAKEANSDEWLFTKYDAFGRVAYTGKARAPEGTSREEVQSDVDSFTDPLWVEQVASGGSFGATTRVFYNNGAYPNNDAEDPSLVALNELLTINYYDNYDFLDSETGLGLPAKVFDKKIENHNNSEKIKTRGLATGSKVKVLTTNEWITTVTGYDAKGRAIFGLSKNPYLGTLDRSETLLDFVGKPLKTKTSHIRDNKTITTIDNFTYDHVGRLLSQTQCIGDETMGGACPNTGNLVDKLLWDGLGPIDSDKEATNSITIKNAVIRPGADGSTTTLRIANGSAQELIVFNTYDALGQLAKKKVGGVPGSNYDNTTGLQEVAYKYNVRGWLTQINDPGNTDKLFNFGLSYNDPKNGATPLFNGNISETAWRTDNDDDSSLKYYSYRYDPLNRITAATGGQNTNHDVTGISYDKNGNIGKLNRRGNDAVSPTSTNYGVIDNLDYQYGPGNKLLSVTDSQTGVFGNQGFKDGNKNGNDYVYDANGNMTQDLNKGIKGITGTEKGITYNHLNLPVTVHINSTEHTGTISYIYDATGVKLQKNVLKNGNTTPTDYAGNYIYENGDLQFFSHAEGYVNVQNGAYEYVYQYSDHLGNVRLSYTDADNNGEIDPATEIIEENNYYPFGLQHKGYNGVTSSLGNSTAQKYMFGGQEYDESLGLEAYDFGSRHYMPDLGRWGNLDPLAEFMRNQSPYNFGFNNPVYFSDYAGTIPWPLPEIVELLGRTYRRKAKPDDTFRRRTRTRFHYGLDLNYNGGGNTDLGAPIVATHSGRVARVIPLSANDGGGRVVVIESPDGSFQTKYMHLSSVSVQPGDEVDEGATIGLMGGSAYGKELGRLVHLHYEIHQRNSDGTYSAVNPWRNGAPIDPQEWIPRMGPFINAEAYNFGSSWSIFDVPFESPGQEDNDSGSGTSGEQGRGSQSKVPTPAPAPIVPIDPQPITPGPGPSPVPINPGPRPQPDLPPPNCIDC